MRVEVVPAVIIIIVIVVVVVVVVIVVVVVVVAVIVVYCRPISTSSDSPGCHATIVSWKVLVGQVWVQI